VETVTNAGIRSRIGRLGKSFLKTIFPHPFIPVFFRVVIKPEELSRVMKKNGLDQPGEDFNLQVAQGPFDGILGQYNPKKDSVTVDVIETAFRAAQSLEPADIDRAVTNVVAHEARHVWQFKRYGWWSFLDKFAMAAAILLSSGYFVIWPNLVFAYKGIFGDGYFVLGVLSLYITYIFGRLSLVVAAKMSYRFCWAERDARRFAAKVADDPDWKSVVEVQLGVPIPPHPFLSGSNVLF